MELNEVLKMVDHTLLVQTATYEDIKKICDDGIKYNTASVCIPPYYVKFAKDYSNHKLKICTVIGFPNGYQTMEVKVYETECAIRDGADEIDMVINICMLKNKEYEKLLHEIKKVKAACGTKILKVIIETCLLTEEEIVTMCEIVTKAEASFIKTSTGFSHGGATFDDVRLMKEHVGESVKIKASGGIQTLDDAVKFIEIGASRLGTSKIVKLANDQESKDGSSY